MNIALQMRDISKRFPGVLANDHINLDIQMGEVHALLGENGAGKSTLMNILGGLYHPDEGTIRWKGDIVQLDGPRMAIDLGIGMVHQNFMLIPKMTVAENVFLGQWRSAGLFYQQEKVQHRVEELSRRYGLPIEPGVRLSSLSAGMQQRVEIIRILSQEPELIILDEPTSVLTPQEVAFLFDTVRTFVRTGKAVCFISHKLDEVMEIADRITVLRDGSVVGTVEKQKTSKEELAYMMVGRKVLFTQASPCKDKGETLLRITNLHAETTEKKACFEDVSLDVRRGEILGIAGISGNGQEELAQAIAGLFPIRSGNIELDGISIGALSVRKRILAGLSYVPNRVRKKAIFLDLDLEHNAILKLQRSSKFSRAGLLNRKKTSEFTQHLIDRFGVKASGSKALARQLSGGNLQKLVLARELAHNPKLILAVNPTAGLDIGAIEYVHGELLEQRDRGLGVILISADLEELLRLSDRIAVICSGKVVGCVESEAFDRGEIGLLMGGAAVDAESDNDRQVEVEHE